MSTCLARVENEKTDKFQIHKENLFFFFFWTEAKSECRVSEFKMCVLLLHIYIFTVFLYVHSPSGK